jgi:Ca2+-binding RTX toxin-like protein
VISAFSTNGSTIGDGITLRGNAVANSMVKLYDRGAMLGQTTANANGHDFANGEDGYDTIFGGTGNDELRGGGGHDFLTGDAGYDRLFGDEDND